MENGGGHQNGFLVVDLPEELAALEIPNGFPVANQPAAVNHVAPGVQNHNHIEPNHQNNIVPGDQNHNALQHQNHIGPEALNLIEPAAPAVQIPEEPGDANDPQNPIPPEPQVPELPILRSTATEVSILEIKYYITSCTALCILFFMYGQYGLKLN